MLFCCDDAGENSNGDRVRNAKNNTKEVKLRVLYVLRSDVQLLPLLPLCALLDEDVCALCDCMVINARVQRPDSPLITPSPHRIANQKAQALYRSFLLTVCKSCVDASSPDGRAALFALQVAGCRMHSSWNQ